MQPLLPPHRQQGCADHNACHASKHGRTRKALNAAKGPNHDGGVKTHHAKRNGDRAGIT